LAGDREYNSILTILLELFVEPSLYSFRDGGSDEKPKDAGEQEVLLTGDEVAKLHAALISAFPTFDHLEMMVRFYFEESLATILSNSDRSVSSAVFELIRWAESEGRVPELLRGALQGNPTNQVLVAVCSLLLLAIAQRQPSKHYQPPNPYGTSLIPGGRPFLGRRELRHALAQLSQPRAEGILVVNGPARSGKSYSIELIRYVTHWDDKFLVAAVDVKWQSSGQIGPDELLRGIALQLGFRLDNFPGQRSQSSRWVRELADWFNGEVRQSGKTCWIVLDGFDHPDIPMETLELIHRLMLQAIRGSENLRLILLQYSENQLPPDVRGNVLTESISAVTRADLEEFFTNILAHSDTQYSPSDIAPLVDEMLAKVPDDPSERTAWLGKSAETYVKKLFS
jgi:hypothetical protein